MVRSAPRQIGIRMDVNWWALPIVWLFTMVQSFFLVEDDQRPTFFKKANNKEAYWFMVGLYTALGLIGILLAFVEALLYYFFRVLTQLSRLTLRVASRLS